MLHLTSCVRWGRRDSLGWQGIFVMVLAGARSLYTACNAGALVQDASLCLSWDNGHAKVQRACMKGKPQHFDIACQWLNPIFSTHFQCNRHPSWVVFACAMNKLECKSLGIQHFNILWWVFKMIDWQAFMGPLARNFYVSLGYDQDILQWARESRETFVLQFGAPRHAYIYFKTLWGLVDFIYNTLHAACIMPFILWYHKSIDLLQWNAVVFMLMWRDMKLQLRDYCNVYDWCLCVSSSWSCIACTDHFKANGGGYSRCLQFPHVEENYCSKQ